VAGLLRDKITDEPVGSLHDDGARAVALNALEQRRKPGMGLHGVGALDGGIRRTRPRCGLAKAWMASRWRLPQPLLMPMLVAELVLRSATASARFLDIFHINQYVVLFLVSWWEISAENKWSLPDAEGKRGAYKEVQTPGRVG